MNAPLVENYYIMFDSQFRNRNLYPNPCYFPIEYGQSNYIVDEICDGIPFAYNHFTSTDTLTIAQKLNPVARYNSPYFPYYNRINSITGSFSYKFNINKTDSFQNIYLTLFDQGLFKTESFCKQLLYGYMSPRFIEDALRFNLMLDQPNVTVNNLTNIYYKNAKSDEHGNATNGTGLTIQLDPTASSADDYYKGWWIWCPASSFDDNIQIKTAKIISYNGTSKVAILDKTLDVVDSYYELSNKIRDSHQFSKQIPLCGLSQDDLYEVRLFLLTLPNQRLTSKSVSTLTALPGVYVYFGNNENCSIQNKIIINNETKGLFYVPIKDLGPFTGEPYFGLTDCYEKITMRLDLKQALYFAVYDNMGNLLQFTDTSSPFPPNRYSQVNALFQLSYKKSKKLLGPEL